MSPEDVTAADSLFAPPERFRHVSFASYQPQTSSQDLARKSAKSFVEKVRRRYSIQRLFRGLRGDDGLGSGLYLVGPVGTGKTHLLASIYHALHPGVPCAFVHSSQLFRSAERPEDYAKALASAFRLLLIDEIELDDPAAEARLIGVLKALKKLRVTVAATSNAEPEKFVSAEFGRDRLERFISEEFRRQYRVVFVGGEDYRKRLQKPGKAWIGPSDQTERAMRSVFESAPGSRKWITFSDLLNMATETERTALSNNLVQYRELYIADISVGNTDDALRLLRIIDDLYGSNNPPTLYFTAEEPPAQWFAPSGSQNSLERGIAEKFARTVSRLNALASIEYVG
ncbi:MAG: AFG1/ZapE family ATPase [Rubricoccaceae bacterium]|nr:AFG1/ZapE family ATPase [Rubricoccaceae bacterium]